MKLKNPFEEKHCDEFRKEKVMGAAYCIFSFILFIFSGVKTHIGLSGFKMIADEFLETMSILSFMNDTVAIQGEALTIAVFLTIAQTAHISKFVGKFTKEDSTKDKIFIFIGNIFLGCYFSILYQSFDYEFLDMMINIICMVFMIPTVIMIAVSMIKAIFKIGILPVVLGISAETFALCYAVFKPSLLGNILVFVLSGIEIAFLTFSNPFTAGLFSVMLSQIAAMLIMMFIGTVVPMPGILFLILSFVISYPVISLCDNNFDKIFDAISEHFSITVEIIFIVLSVAVTGIGAAVAL